MLSDVCASMRSGRCLYLRRSILEISAQTRTVGEMAASLEGGEAEEAEKYCDSDGAWSIGCGTRKVM